MQKLFIIALAFAVFFAACNGHTKRIIVYANNDANIDEQSKMIVEKDTEGHDEQTLQYNTSDNITLHVTAPSGEKNIEIPDDGLFIANLKAKDTIVGGYQKYSTPEEANRVMTQEQLHHNIDSLHQMIQGQNNDPAGKTFFILPYTAAKISENDEATVVGPYHSMTSIEMKNGKAPEVYRFYSINEVRETITKLEKLTESE